MGIRLPRAPAARALVVLGGLLCGASSAPAAQPPAAINPAAAVAAQWASAWSAKQLEQVADLYAADAVFLPADGDPLAGASAIRASFHRRLASVTPVIRVRSLHAGRSGALAYDTGEYEETLVSPEGKRDRRGSYVMVCRRDAGRWRIVLHAWTETARKP